MVKFAEAGSKQTGGEQGGKRLKNGSSLSISSSSSAAAAFSPLSSLQAAAFITGAGGAGAGGSPLLDSSSYLNLIKAHQVQQQQQAQQAQQQHQQQQLMSLAALQSAQSPYGSLASAEAAMAAVYGGGGGLLSSLGGGAGKTGISALTASPLHQQLFAGTGASPKLLGESALPLSSFAGLSTLGHHPHHTLPHSAYASALTGPALAKLAAVSAAAASSTSSASRQVEGPEGANLFIYHLPGKHSLKGEILF